jgi:hypothetical protein
MAPQGLSQALFEDVENDPGTTESSAARLPSRWSAAPSDPTM